MKHKKGLDDWTGLPICCMQCVNLDFAEDIWGISGDYFCTENIIFPTKKLTCKKQNLVKDNKSEIQQLQELNKTIIKKNGFDESEVKEIVDEVCGRNK